MFLLHKRVIKFITLFHVPLAWAIMAVIVYCVLYARVANILRAPKWA